MARTIAIQKSIRNEDKAFFEILIQVDRKIGFDFSKFNSHNSQEHVYCTIGGTLLMSVNISKESPNPSVPHLTYFNFAGGW